MLSQLDQNDITNAGHQRSDENKIMMSPMGCTYSDNSVDLSTDPCGTPDVTRVVFVDASRMTTRSIRPSR